jgi:hypothetical protein
MIARPCSSGFWPSLLGTWSHHSRADHRRTRCNGWRARAWSGAATRWSATRAVTRCRRTAPDSTMENVIHRGGRILASARISPSTIIAWRCVRSERSPCGERTSRPASRRRADREWRVQRSARQPSKVKSARISGGATAAMFVAWHSVRTFSTTNTCAKPSCSWWRERVFIGSTARPAAGRPE